MKWFLVHRKGQDNAQIVVHMVWSYVGGMPRRQKDQLKQILQC
jgi:hypothetical protein